MKKTYLFILLVSVIFLLIGCKKDGSPESILKNLKISETEYYYSTLNFVRYFEDDSYFDNNTEMLTDYENDQLMITYQHRSNRDMQNGEISKVDDWFFQDAHHDDYIFQERYVVDENDNFIRETFSVYEYVSNDRKTGNYESAYEQIPKLIHDFSKVDLSQLNITYWEDHTFHHITIVLDYETLLLIEPNFSEFGILNNPFFYYGLFIDDKLNLIGCGIGVYQDIEIAAGVIYPFTINAGYPHSTQTVQLIEFPNEQELALHRSNAGYPDTP